MRGSERGRICPHCHLRQARRSIGRYHCHIQRVTTSPNEDSSYAGLIIAWIKGPPAPREVYLHPGAEIHRVVRWRDSYIWQVAEYITSRNVERSTKSHGQVREIAAHAYPLRSEEHTSELQSHLNLV